MPRGKKNLKTSKGAQKRSSYSLRGSSIKAETTYSLSKNKVTRGSEEQSLLQRVNQEFNNLNLDRSYLNLFLGLVILLVVGLLAFNYFKRDRVELGPAQQTAQQQDTSSQEVKDATPENLPGKYTVKEGDTLFTISEAYYKDGFKFQAIADANRLENADSITVGQVLEIPKLEGTQAAPTAAESAQVDSTGETQGEGKGGAVNQTTWGERITGDVYTVMEGDWLSTIAGRAYGDIMAFEKIAQANNISNPDYIQAGMVLKIPR